MPKTFTEALKAYFPGAMPERDYLTDTRRLLADHGFVPDVTLTAVAVCRDEIAASLVEDVRADWGPTFSLASLAGMVSAGRTGFGAAAAHAPVDQDRRRFVVYAMPHIGLDEHGTPGVVSREGVHDPSSACGALGAFRDELEEGTIHVALDSRDAEMSLLRNRLLPLIRYGDVPSLVDVTRLTADVIADDLSTIMKIITDANDDAPVDGAMFTGIQIHGPDGANWVWPRTAHVVTAGRSRPLGDHVGLTETTWHLIELDGEPAAAGAGGRFPDMTLHSSANLAGGFAGCNTYSGNYEATDDGIAFGPFAVTAMACAEGMDLEQRFLAALGSATSYRLLGETLALLDDNHTLAQFEADD